MTTSNKIRYLNYRDIDTIKWDRCIEEADNGLIYAYSFYLFIMAGKCDALVLNDYEAVMPLTWNRKYGFYYLYQPYFLPFLGVFGKKLSPLTVLDFLSSIPKKFRYWNIDLNEANVLTNNENSLRLSLTTRVNYQLKLDLPYAGIYAGFKKTCQRRIRKARRNQVQIVRDAKPAGVIEFYRKHYDSKHPKISPAVYKKLIEATTICFEKDLVKIYLAKLPNGEITGAYLVLVDKNFVYLLIGGSSEKGKQIASFYLLTNAIIEDYAGSGKTLRFEGSDIPGVALFNAQFGSEISNYLHVKRNVLPFPVNLLKR